MEEWDVRPPLPPSPQYRPSSDRLRPNTVAFFQVSKRVFLIYDSFHHGFPNTTGFSSVPRSAVLVGTTVYDSLYCHFFSKEARAGFVKISHFIKKSIPGVFCTLTCHIPTTNPNHLPQPPAPNNQPPILAHINKSTLQCTRSFKSCYTPLGTNFGYMNGAMSKDGYKYNVRVTSYDYDSPLTEAGTNILL